MKEEKFEKVLTPPFRMSYPHLFEKYSMDGKSPKYQLAMLFPKRANLGDLFNLYQKAVVEKFGNQVPNNLKNPFLDGDKQNGDSSKGCWVLRTMTSREVNIIDHKKVDVISPKYVIPGYWARATVNCFYWSKRSDQGVIINQGFSFGLQNVQLLPIEAVIKLYEGQDLDYELVEEAFGGTSTPAKDDFEEVYVPSDNPANYQMDTSADWTKNAPNSDRNPFDDIPFNL